MFSHEKARNSESRKKAQKDAKIGRTVPVHMSSCEPAASLGRSQWWPMSSREKAQSDSDGRKKAQKDAKFGHAIPVHARSCEPAISRNRSQQPQPIANGFLIDVNRLWATPRSRSSANHVPTFLCPFEPFCGQKNSPVETSQVRATPRSRCSKTDVPTFLSPFVPFCGHLNPMLTRGTL